MPKLLQIGLLFLLTAALLTIPSETGMADTGTTDAALNPIMDFMMIVVFAPFFEEIIFRWYLFNKMALKISPLKAMIFSSFVFGILHVQNIIPSMIFGIVWCTLFLKYKSLFPCIIIHLANNTLAYFLLFASQQTADTSAAEIPAISMILTFSIVLITISSLWLIRFWKKNKVYIIEKRG
jgi:membrane protease YdiL (CAAX protease family)